MSPLTAGTEREEATGIPTPPPVSLSLKLCCDEDQDVLSPGDCPKAGVAVRVPSPRAGGER